MEPENTYVVPEATEQKSSLHQVTPLSKYLAMILFVLMPFIGGYIGYTFAPEKVVEVEKIVEVERESVAPMQEVDESRTIVSQIMWYWRADVDTDNVIAIEPYVQSTENPLRSPFLLFKAPEDWLMSVDETNTSKSLRFVDPEIPGKPDTDAIGAHISFTFDRDSENCEDIATIGGTFGLYGQAKNLGTEQVSVYDSGWQSGWADKPDRTLCIDPMTQYGEIITVRMFPITEENQTEMETLLAEFDL